MNSPATLPPPVRPGDRVGVAALSGPLDTDRLDRGIEALRELGFRPVQAANLRVRRGLFAGGDAERLAAFHELAADPDLKAIVFARGGSGMLRVLPHVDWELLGRHPRAYVGYSDLTPFLLQVVKRLGLVAFHGPMVAGELARGLEPEERSSLIAALAGDIATSYELEWCAGRTDVEGPLVGGCLSMLTATLGTAFAPELDGAVLFVEDVDEPPYRIDRMLTHLGLSGNLNHLQGMVAGHMTGDEPSEETSADDDSIQEIEVDAEAVPRHQDLVRELADGVDLPVAWGLRAGHAMPNLTLPLGAWVRLSPASRTLEVLPQAGAREW